MRKLVFGRHFSRGRKGREALLKSLLKALIIHGGITTTKARAKGVQPDAERVANWAKVDTIQARRAVAGMVGNNRKLVETVFNKIGKAIGGKQGGYTRIILLPNRKGDSAQMARIEWSETFKEEPKKTAKETKEKKVKKEVKKTVKKTVKKEVKSKK
jgi:large subunit ribosomal protein L17